MVGKMKYEISDVKKILINDLKDLDPISLYIEEYNKAGGKLVITCFDKSWSYYWGAIGDKSLIEFILSADNHYLSKKLNSGVKSDIEDYEGLESYAKKQIIESRKNHFMQKELARNLYDDCHSLEEYKDMDSNRYIEMMYEILGDEWYACLPTKPNPEYQYFCKILDAMKDALKEIKEKCAV